MKPDKKALNFKIKIVDNFLDNNNNSTECDAGTPRRLPYPDLEKKSNSNVPPGDSIYDRVENDPN